MPWSGPSFAKKHNHSLNPSEAKSAARQATALVEKGVPEGESIAVANKNAKVKRLKKAGKISDRMAEKHGLDGAPKA